MKQLSFALFSKKVLRLSQKDINGADRNDRQANPMACHGHSRSMATQQIAMDGDSKGFRQRLGDELEVIISS
ncbi:hypothetical protein HYY75_07260 [bacterium]|nr:hypothetical protein [bacterium]